MAEHKIQLHLGAKYDGTAAFQAMQDDTKKGQRAMSDFVGATKRGLTQISGSFGAEIQETIKTTTGLLEQFVSGGIYGIAGAVATLAVNSLVQWFSDMS